MTDVHELTLNCGIPPKQRPSGLDFIPAAMPELGAEQR